MGAGQILTVLLFVLVTGEVTSGETTTATPTTMTIEETTATTAVVTGTTSEATTTGVATTTTSVQTSNTADTITTTASAPTASTEAPTATTADTTPTTGAPTTTTAAPAATTGAPTTTTGASMSTTAAATTAGSITTAGTATTATTAATTATAAASTTMAALATTTAAPTTSAAAPDTTGAPTATTAAPTTTGASTSTTATATAATAAASTTTAALATTTAASTTAAAPTTTNGAPTTTTAPPTTTTGAPTTTTAVPTTTTTTTAAPIPVVILTAVFVTPYQPALADKSSPQFKALEAQVVQVYDIVYKARYGRLFIRVIVIAFRPAVTIRRESNTEAEVQLVFNETATPAEIPKAADVAQTLQEAVSNPNNTFNLTVDAASVQVFTIIPTTAVPTVNTTDPGTTTTAAAKTPTSAATLNITALLTTTTVATTPTAAPTTTTVATTPTAAPTTTKLLQFRSVGETFTIDLLNPSSTAFKTRANLTVTTIEPFYKRAFPSFRSLSVTGFSNGSIITDINIQFESTSVPNNTEIGNVLINAAPNITVFTITRDSVVVTDIATTVGTTGATTATNTSMATRTTATSVTTVEPVTELLLQFKSNEIFIQGLADQTSTAFKNRSTLIVTTLTSFYSRAFSSFRSLRVIFFSPGSIINYIAIGFSSSSVPNPSEIGKVLINAASNITAFNINTTSVSVNGIQVSHAVSHNISLLTASCMVLLSWLLSGQQ